MTQTADVDVNSATIRLFHVPLLVEKGIISSIVPTAMTARNPKQIVRATVIINLKFKIKKFNHVRYPEKIKYASESKSSLLR